MKNQMRLFFNFIIIGMAMPIYGMEKSDGNNPQSSLSSNKTAENFNEGLEEKALDEIFRTQKTENFLGNFILNGAALYCKHLAYSYESWSWLDHLETALMHIHSHKASLLFQSSEFKDSKELQERVSQAIKEKDEKKRTSESEKFRKVLMSLDVSSSPYIQKCFLEQELNKKAKLLIFTQKKNEEHYMQQVTKNLNQCEKIYDLEQQLIALKKKISEYAQKDLMENEKKTPKKKKNAPHPQQNQLSNQKTLEKNKKLKNQIALNNNIIEEKNKKIKELESQGLSWREEKKELNIKRDLELKKQKEKYDEILEKKDTNMKELNSIIEKLKQNSQEKDKENKELKTQNENFNKITEELELLKKKLSLALSSETKEKKDPIIQEEPEPQNEKHEGASDKKTINLQIDSNLDIEKNPMTIDNNIIEKNISSEDLKKIFANYNSEIRNTINLEMKKIEVNLKKIQITHSNTNDSSLEELYENYNQMENRMSSLLKENNELYKLIDSYWYALGKIWSNTRDPEAITNILEKIGFNIKKSKNSETKEDMKNDINKLEKDKRKMN